MSLLNTFINDVKLIKNHREALKHYQVRYVSFNQNFPTDCFLPTCTLAEFGFYFEEKSKSIKCFECDFKYDELNQDCLFLIFHKHLKHKPKCSQVLHALEATIYDCRAPQQQQQQQQINDSDLLNMEKNEQIFSKSIAVVNQQQPTKKTKYANEYVRFQTFENVEILLNARTLAENGFYMVSNESQTNILSKSKSSNSLPIPVSSSTLNNNNISSSINQEDSNTIEKIATLVPALIYIKCAFCTYECLIFKNSVLNTMYKSPLEEHWEKSKSVCFIFTNSEPVKSSYSNNNEKHLDWLQCLLDFDSAETTTSTTPSSSPKKAVDILTNQNDLNKQTDDLIVKQIPKVIDQLVIHERNKQNSNIATSYNVLYVPKSGSKGPSGPTTSDFRKLKNVLKLSDNVLNKKAMHPAYTLCQTRFESYNGWPATLLQKPANLAKAGFYYFGIKDMVTCYFCGGGLKNWDHNDDPYEDHVRWFPKCQFIRLLMGAEFVENVKEKYKNKDSGFSNYNDDLSLNRGHNLGSKKGSATRSNRSRTLNSYLDTNIIRRMLDTIHLITIESIEIQLSSNVNKASSTTPANIYADDFKSTIEMAKLAIEIETNKAKKIETFKSISDFIICNIYSKINIENIQNFMLFKYNVYPNHVRILRENGSENRCFALVSLDKKHEDIIDEIVKDLNQQNSLLNKNETILAFKTVWNEFEEKIKPILLKQPTTAVGLLQQPTTNLMELPANMNANNSEQILSNHTQDIIESEINFTKEQTKIELVSRKTEIMAVDDKNVLIEENERLKGERLCVVCLNKDKNVLFLPCAHLAACLDCCFNLNNCAICRSKIQAFVRTFS